MNLANPNLCEIDSFMAKKGQEYRRFDPNRAKNIFTKLKIALKDSSFVAPKKVIQIIGTNGKGSSGRFLALGLMQNGASVVHFTSPHIFSFSERFYKNGDIVGGRELLNAHEKLQKLDFMREASYFEYATFLAYVLANRVDYLILEAGVGGEFDSTSVIERDMCVFSVIDFDHEEMLGTNIKSIATTKLNAMVSPSVLGFQYHSEVIKIAKKIAKQKNVELILLDSIESRILKDDFLDLKDSIDSTDSTDSINSTESKNSKKQKDSKDSKDSAQSLDLLDSAESFALDSLDLAKSLTSFCSFGDIKDYILRENLAPFLFYNLALSLKSLEILGLTCALDRLPRLDLKGRFERISKNVIIDVGHNKSAAFAIKSSLKNNKVVLVYNSYFQKNIKEILSILKDNIIRVEILEVENNERIVKKEDLTKILESLKIKYSDFTEIREEFQYLVFGSFSVVEKFLRLGIV